MSCLTFLLKKMDFLCPLDVGDQKAFTLLEVMIAVSILAIGLVTLFGSQSKSLSLATEAKFNNIAPMLASGKLAELKAGNIPLAAAEGDFGDDFPGYIWEIDVEDAVFEASEALTGLDEQLQRVDLKVLWSGTVYSYSFTYYSRPLEPGE